MIAVLFAHARSHYKALPMCDVWDARRDARTFPGGKVVIAHPPCGPWGRYRVRARQDDRDLAPWAVSQVRCWGGVVEHPAFSTLWSYCGLPRPASGFDQCGGWTLGVSQQWWGHRARKDTWLYIVGCVPAVVPPIPLVLGEATAVVATSRRQRGRPWVTHDERVLTPPSLCEWLVLVAQRCEAKAA